MKRPRLENRYHAVRVKSYVIGFVLSIVTTLIAYLFVVNKFLPMTSLIYLVLGLALVQLVIQMVFFLHIGRGSRWKAVTFGFTILVVIIIVGGTLWIMANLNYNMMHMSPDEKGTYMKQHEGI